MRQLRNDEIDYEFWWFDAEDGPIHWLPREIDMQRLALLAKLAGEMNGNEKPSVVQVGAGTGFLAYQLALREELEILATDPNQEALFGNPEDGLYCHPNLYRAALTSAETRAILDKHQVQTDMSLLSWAPPEIQEVFQDARNLDATVFVTVSNHMDELDDEYDEEDLLGNKSETERQIRFLECFHQYVLVMEWRGPARHNVRTVVSNIDDLNNDQELDFPSQERLQDNIIRVFVKKDVAERLVQRAQTEIVNMTQNQAQPWEDIETLGGLLTDGKTQLSPKNIKKAQELLRNLLTIAPIQWHESS